MNFKLEGSFEVMYARYVHEQRLAAKGGRRDRLKEEGAHGHAEKVFLEKVWWPVFQHFNALQAEYEVRDFKDGYRYLDFAYMAEAGDFKLCIEIDGYNSHYREVSRWQAADNLLRQNHLILDGWTVLRFLYDDVLDKPRRCQQILQQYFGQRALDTIATPILPNYPLNYIEREIILSATRQANHSVLASSVAQSLGISNKRVRAACHKLRESGILLPIHANTTRVRKYQLHPNYRHISVAKR